jgi:hypothetical protein
MLNIRVMTMDDYNAVIELMTSTPGVSIRDADSRESTSRYLERNPDMTSSLKSERLYADASCADTTAAEGICSTWLFFHSIGDKALRMRWWSAAFQVWRNTEYSNVILTCLKPT